MGNRGEVKDPEHDKRVKHPERYEEKQSGSKSQDQDKNRDSRSKK